ncbi:MAG: histidine phosphatase family protein [Acidobacteriota bacterium]|nr:histidine phosphatase family protein [Acidobacteriota bacterium]
MPRIIFIRPAETDHSTHDLVLGRHDVDLSEKGYAQTRQLADALAASYQIDFLGASPVKRALSTAMPISYCYDDLSVIPVAGFRAMDMGEWENRGKEEINMSDGRRYQSFLTDPDFRSPGGESRRDVYARAFPHLIDIVKHTGPDETIALVLQEAVMQVLCCGTLDLSLESANRFQVDNGAFAVFERLYADGPYQLVAWNRNSHLKPVEEEELEEISAY